MALIPSEALPYFEKLIYLPMLKVIMERDRETIEISQFKFKSPYLSIVEIALKRVQDDIKATNIHARRNKMQVIKRTTDADFTEYLFVYGGHEDPRRYLNVRLRNRTEDLLHYYLRMGEVNNGN